MLELVPFTPPPPPPLPPPPNSPLILPTLRLALLKPGHEAELKNELNSITALDGRSRGCVLWGGGAEGNDLWNTASSQPSLHTCRVRVWAAHTHTHTHTCLCNPTRIHAHAKHRSNYVICVSCKRWKRTGCRFITKSLLETKPERRRALWFNRLQLSKQPHAKKKNIMKQLWKWYILNKIYQHNLLVSAANSHSGPYQMTALREVKQTLCCFLSKSSCCLWLVLMRD